MRYLAILLAGLIAFTLILFGLTAFWAPLNQDEGWYLYAARLVSQGQMPYRDFFYTQGPVMPYVYAACQPFISLFGLLGGRFITAFFGFGAILFAAETAANCVQRTEERIGTRCIVWALAASSLYHITFLTIPKTYGLCALLIAAAYYAMSHCTKQAIHDNKSPPPQVTLTLSGLFIGGVLLALATGVRLSIGILLPITGIWLICMRKRLAGRFGWLAFGLGGGISLIAIFTPFLVNDFDAFCFAQSFHTGREHGGLLFDIGSLLRLLRAYFPVAGLLIALFIKRHFDPHDQLIQPGNRSALVELWLWATGGVIISNILLCPMPYDDYNVPIMLLPMMVVGISFAAIPKRLARLRMTLVTIGCCICLWLPASPLIQEWFILRTDAFWPILRGTSQLESLTLAAEPISDILKPAETLLTQDLYLAIEANRNVPEGFAMGPFSYFPHIDTDTARRYHVHNTQTLLEEIRTGSSPMIALSGYSFRLEAPLFPYRTKKQIPSILRQTIEAYYPHSHEIYQHPSFGQNDTGLSIRLKKED